MIRPKGIDLHYEVELALIMGKEVRDLDAADEKGALDAIESMLCLFQHFKLDLVANSRRLCYEH